MLGMTTISIVHTKGGVGKTTSAMFMATVAAQQGLDVAVVDADPQGSATAWEEAAGGMPFPVYKSPRSLEVPNHDLVLVDTPPGTSGIIQDAIEEADLILIPCGASPIDAQRVWPTLEITEGRLAVVVLTSVDFRSSLWVRVKDTLKAELVPVAGSQIPGRTEIKKAFGTVPTKFFGYEDLLIEVQVVTKSV
ncbi:ParA-like dsDNA partitioning protein [Gordonia phage Strosahl]|uniref:ParA-like dsDNA partitioning protein n=2 Tax=Soupsvirus strosahl TaxID=2560510 RepID=A0A1B3B137_9CAUD|nr:ParA-like partition protein [Gordonia phage Strosahl]AOE44747.1 ParA-like dsDNA partitioning protein [Gordonia phage Strosahl]